MTVCNSSKYLSKHLLHVRNEQAHDKDLWPAKFQISPYVPQYNKTSRLSLFEKPVGCRRHMRSAKTGQTARMRRLIWDRWSHKSYCKFSRALAEIIKYPCIKTELFGYWFTVWIKLQEIYNGTRQIHTITISLKMKTGVNKSCSEALMYHYTWPKRDITQLFCCCTCILKWENDISELQKKILSHYCL